MPTHTVEQGDCLSSIAQESGLTWQALWNAPENDALRAKRKSPNILQPGDVVFIPDKRPVEQPMTLAATNYFQLNNVPARISIQLFWGGEPRANEAYQLSVDGANSEGQTDGDGRVIASIPPIAKQGKLTIGEGLRKVEYDLDLGHLDPVEDKNGVKARLANLGVLHSLDATDEEVAAAMQALGVQDASALGKFHED